MQKPESVGVIRANRLAAIQKILAKPFKSTKILKFA